MQKLPTYAFLNKNRPLHNSFDAKNCLKLTSAIHPFQRIVALGTSTCCYLKVFSLRSKRKGLLQHTVDNEVSPLASLTFYEDLLIGQETSVHCQHN